MNIIISHSSNIVPDSTCQKTMPSGGSVHTQSHVDM